MGPGLTAFITRNELARIAAGAAAVTRFGNGDLDARLDWRAAANGDPNRAWIIEGNTAELRFDYGAATAKWRALAVINHNLTSSAQVRVRGNSTDSWTTPLVDSGPQSLHNGSNRALDGNGALILENSAYCRWWRIDIANTVTDPDPIWTCIGELWVGVKEFDRVIAAPDEDMDENQRHVIGGFMQPVTGLQERGFSIAALPPHSDFSSDYGQRYRYLRRPRSFRVIGSSGVFASGAQSLINLMNDCYGGRPLILIPDTSRKACFFVRLEADEAVKEFPQGSRGEEHLFSAGGFSFMQPPLALPVNARRPFV